MNLYFTIKEVFFLNYTLLLDLVISNSFSLPRKLFFFFSWLYVSISYLLNNWVYTTNHKRIGINYFNFALVSGTVGMSLATVIRIELAYPGAAILAGDSLQYLSIASGHGVVMVFFMIMPVLFGAFANFLLPTQLGVHDVAFPRLNSAAFWFLPGGLIMLGHLICVDRRFQRLNFFNIKEFQTVLKKKHFLNLVNTNEHNHLLNKTIIGLRYKKNLNSNYENGFFNFYKHGITSTEKTKFFTIDTMSYLNSYNLNLSNNWLVFREHLTLFFYRLVLFLSNITMKDVFFFIVSYVKSTSLFKITVNFCIFTKEYFSLLLGLGYDSIIPSTSQKFVLFHITSFFNLLQTPFYILNINFSCIYYKSADKVRYNTMINSNDINSLYIFNNMELSNCFRSTSSFSSRINIDFKCGEYGQIWRHRYPMTFLTDNEYKQVAKILVPIFYFNEVYEKTINTFYSGFPLLFSNAKYTKDGDEIFISFLNADRIGVLNQKHNYQSNNILPIDNFFNFFYVNNQLSNELNIRWIAFNNLNQKFYSMFNTNTTQQRLMGKWRELKFTREAWRCKLLTAKNQNTWFRKHVNEEGIIWSIDRNSKDLIPGWAMITPFSSRPRYTLIGKTDVGLMAVFLAINASIISSVNFLVTYRYLSTLNNRKMRDARSFFSESIIVASWMMVAANPMLAIGILMLLSDRHWRTSFFDFSGGGDAVMFQHMFWFFGHPEVYVIMIPVFGFANTILSYSLRKRISARASLIYSMYTIAFLGFWVWGHHMYMVGLSHTTRMLFSTLTVMISVPAATKLMHWCVTIVNSSFIVELPLLFTLVFIFFFVSGGISGMAVANTSMDVLFHDTFYVIGHFHVMLAGSGMFGIFAGFYFYFPAIYGVKYSRIYAYIHFVYYLFGQLFTVIPMFWLGYCGMPRRVLDYPFVLGGWHSIATSGHLLSVAAMVSFFIMIYDSIRQSKSPVRRTFGPSRFNTRLNFYLYESYRVSFIQRRSFFMVRSRINPIYENRLFKPLKVANREINLFSYYLVQK